jgi:hypothetical protein
MNLKAKIHIKVIYFTNNYDEKTEIACPEASGIGVTGLTSLIE